jgi:hypothetical protein
MGIVPYPTSLSRGKTYFPRLRAVLTARMPTFYDVEGRGGARVVGGAGHRLRGDPAAGGHLDAAARHAR